MLPVALMLAAAAVSNGPGPIRVGIYLEAPAGTRMEILESFRDEVTRIVSRPGAELQWRNEISGNEAFHRVLVIRLRGACTAQQTELPRGPASLGSTHVNNGQVKPFIDISCTQVMSALTRSWRWPANQAPPETYAKALARVAAHEVYHALTESVAHDEEGLMKPSFDRHDLCGRKLDLTQAAIARLERALGLGVRPAD